jgi:ABC-type bacteriocin/lantibiotic exporter with double-glycine peptidase domain
MVLVVARQCGLPADVGVEELLVAFFITYWVMLLLPIVSLMFLPGLKTRINKLLDWQGQHQATVVPTIRNVNTVPGT